MAEFKIDNALRNEISNLKSSGNQINEGYKKIPSEDVKTLKTSMSVISQHGDIKRLFDLYKLLIQRDVQDLNNLVKEAKEMDESISMSHKT